MRRVLDIVRRLWKNLATMFAFLRRESPPGYDELADRLDRLERQEKMLELEWESVYNKMRSLMARLNKRDEREGDIKTMSPPDGDEYDRIIALRRGRR